MRTVLGLLALLVAVLGAAVAMAGRRWRGATAEWTAKLGGESAAGTVSFAGFDSLPAPAARSFRSVLRQGQPGYRHGVLTQKGQFLVKPPNGWQPFTATHTLTTDPPGFVWDARIRIGPGLAMRVRDRLVAAQGSIHGALLGLVTVVRVEQVYVAERMRDVNGTGVPTPWEGRFHGYTEVGSMRIPAGGDVGRVSNGASQPYFRGTITGATYR